jgi:hypothetical protein
MQEFNSFIERSEKIKGHKLDYENGIVYVVEIYLTAVADIIRSYFNDLCPISIYDSYSNAPIQTRGMSCNSVYLISHFLLYFPKFTKYQRELSCYLSTSYLCSKSSHPISWSASKRQKGVYFL